MVMGSLSKRARVMPVSFNSGCDRRRNSLLASSFEGIYFRASSGDNMDRRSLTYKWTQEDRLTRSNGCADWPSSTDASRFFFLWLWQASKRPMLRGTGRHIAPVSLLV